MEQTRLEPGLPVRLTVDLNVIFHQVLNDHVHPAFFRRNGKWYQTAIREVDLPAFLSVAPSVSYYPSGTAFAVSVPVEVINFLPHLEVIEETVGAGSQQEKMMEEQFHKPYLSFFRTKLKELWKKKKP